MWTMGPALEFEVHAPLYMPPHPRQGLSPLRTSMSLSVKPSIFFAGTETHTRGYFCILGITQALKPDGQGLHPSSVGKAV